MESNKKQSSIDWLVEQLIPNAMRMFDATTCNAIEQAKAMHKEEIEDAYNKSFILRDKPYSTAVKYYKETYEREDNKH